MTVDELHAAGRAAWPEVPLERDVLGAYLGERLPIKGQRIEVPVTVPPADLYLACACLQGIPSALLAFERTLMPAVADYVARQGGQAAFADEVRQQVRDDLFVAKSKEPPRIARYSGRGPLAAWLRIVAVRTARALVRSRGRELPLRDEAARAATANDPETDFLKGHYGRVFDGAFEAALSGLPLDQRNVLRLYFLDDLTLEQIGAIYHVHASTVMRWITRSRQAILARTRAELGERLRSQLPASEFQSLLGLVHSRLDLSIAKLLKKDGG
jgi:RNA polymerase sigma-70 factor (ECF subfamily)